MWLSSRISCIDGLTCYVYAEVRNRVEEGIATSDAWRERGHVA
jgi:hypothetical protein